MSSGFLLLHLFLWSFSTSISNDPSDQPPATLAERSGAQVPHDVPLDAPAEPPALPTGFPKNIVVQPELRATIVRLWAGSPTFRAQCLKIGAKSLYRVAVTLDPVLALNSNYRAQCTLRVYSTGFVSARVTIPSSRDLDELIAHELEHIVEHIEGVDVRRNLSRSGTGAWDAGRGRIETVRATRAGRQVRDELLAETRTLALLTRR
jgi:hypothetical protein